MQTQLPEPRRGEIRPIRAMVDSCVFPRRKDWLQPILDAARAGHLIPLWSPAILAETNRLLTWLWLRRHGGELSLAAWRACSTAAKTWFRIVSAAFHVVEDRPPLVDMWTLQPRDPHDAPIWTAAVRGGADFVVTENLRDGPPSGAEGLRAFSGIAYIHPDPFRELLAVWAEITATGVAPRPTELQAAGGRLGQRESQPS